MDFADQLVPLLFIQAWWVALAFFVERGVGRQFQLPALAAIPILGFVWLPIYALTVIWRMSDIVERMREDLAHMRDEIDALAKTSRDRGSG